MSTLFPALTELTLRDPWMLALVVLVPLGLWVRWRNGAPAVDFAPAEFTARRSATGRGPRMPRSWRVWLLPLPPALRAVALVLAVVALARPVARVQLPLEIRGIDIFLCLDVSSSMAANDLDPQRSRLDVAKEAAIQFASGRPSDRIGLVRFARFPDLLCPPTLDHRALERFLRDLERVDPDGMEDLTGVGTAVARATQALRGSEAKSKVVILLTDGEENVATKDTPDEIGPLPAARLSRELGVRVYIIAAGIGKRTRTGEWVDLDTRQMRSLAETTGGAFYEARDAQAVSRVYATINQMEKVEFEQPRYELHDRFLAFVIAAMILLLAGRLLHATLLEVLP